MLTNYVKVYIPSTRQGSVPLTKAESKKVIDNTIDKLSRFFGGCTGYNATGSYTSDTLGTITEKITIAQSFHNIDVNVAWEFITSIARDIKAELSQESVTIESNQGIEFI